MENMGKMHKVLEGDNMNGKPLPPVPAVILPGNPHIESATLLRVEKGDMIILHVGDTVPPSQISELREEFQRFVRKAVDFDIPVAIMYGSEVKIEIIKPDLSSLEKRLRDMERNLRELALSKG